MSKERVAVYAEALSDVSDDLLFSAITNWIRKGTHFPTPGHLRKAAGLSDETEACSIYHRVREYAQRFGIDWPAKAVIVRPKKVDGEFIFDSENRVVSEYVNTGAKELFSPRVVYAVDSVYGLAAIRNPSESDAPFIEKRFIEAYLRFPMINKPTELSVPPKMLDNLAKKAAL